MYQYPYGNAQQLNLDWLIEQWKTVKQSIDGSLQGEIDRVEAAITDLLAARDAAVAAAGAANTSAGAAAQSAQAAAADAATAAAQAAAANTARSNAAQAANNAQAAAGNAQTQAAAAQNAAGQAAASASQAAADASDAHDDALAASGSAVNAAASAAGALQNFQLSDAARQAAQAAEQAAQDVLNSIPEDYSEMTNDVSELKTALTVLPDNFTRFATLPDFKKVTTINTETTIVKNVITIKQTVNNNSNSGIDLITPADCGVSPTLQYVQQHGFKIPANSMIKFSLKTLESTILIDDTSRTASLALRVYWINSNEGLSYEGFSAAYKKGVTETKYAYNLSNDCFILPVLIRSSADFAYPNETKFEYTISVYNLIADANIGINQFFQIDDQLFYSTAAISKDSIITIGTNALLRTLTQALNSL